MSLAAIQSRNSSGFGLFNVLCFSPGLLQIHEKKNPKQNKRLDQHLMRLALIRSSTAANVLPSQPRGLGSLRRQSG